MKVMVLYTVQAIVDITEIPGMAAKVTIEHNKDSYTTLVINDKEPSKKPEPDEVMDYRKIALTYVLMPLMQKAEEAMSEIGEPALTQAKGDA